LRKGSPVGEGERRAVRVQNTTTRLCVLAHHLLIWRGNGRIDGYNVSLKRQEPTRLSQSQSPSPLCEDINSRVFVELELELI
jgi:hypothetical protein